MTASTAVLIWLYAVVNGQEVGDLGDKVKGEARDVKGKAQKEKNKLSS
jgi:hypothetical protein